MVLIVDFDGQPAQRQRTLDDSTPEQLKDRVFVLGALTEPEDLRSLGTFEEIGQALPEQHCGAQRARGRLPGR